MSRTAARAIVDNTSNHRAGSGSDSKTFKAGVLDTACELGQAHGGNVPTVLGVDVLVLQDSVACDLFFFF
jgi:hypothetical protein